MAIRVTNKFWQLMFPLRAVLEPCLKNVIIPIVGMVKDSISTTSKLLAESRPPLLSNFHFSYENLFSYSLLSHPVVIDTATATITRRTEQLLNRKTISFSKRFPASNIYVYQEAFTYHDTASDFIIADSYYITTPSSSGHAL